MTDDTVTSVDMDDLDAFEDVFYGRTEPEKEPAKEDSEPAEKVAENESNQLATEAATDAPEGDDGEEDDETEGEEEDTPEEPEVKDKPKTRKSAKERIEELVAEARVAQRERDAERNSRLALEQRLAALEKANKPVEEVPEKLAEMLDPDAPKPDALDRDGNPLYPLGEFDRDYIAAITRYTIAKETAAVKAQAAQEAEAQRMNAAREAIQAEWSDKVAEAEKDIPELKENIQTLVEAFEGVEPMYGEYLATTIMSSENGPAIMNYLSQNIGEAQKIVASGPYAATLSIGRLDAKLAKTPTEEKSNAKLVSNAPTPPPSNKGRSKSSSIRPDTDDLDAFERMYFGKD